MAGGNLKRSSECSSYPHFNDAETSAAAMDNQSRSKEAKKKSPQDTAEEALRSEQSETLIEPADVDVEDFEDDPTAWKWETPCRPCSERHRLLASQSVRFATEPSARAGEEARPLASRICKERPRTSKRPTRRAPGQVSGYVHLLTHLTCTILLTSNTTNQLRLSAPQASSNSRLSSTTSSPLPSPQSARTSPQLPTRFKSPTSRPVASFCTKSPASSSKNQTNSLHNTTNSPNSIPQPRASKNSRRTSLQTKTRPLRLSPRAEESPMQTSTTCWLTGYTR
jgi:hypothetical protein